MVTAKWQSTWLNLLLNKRVFWDLNLLAKAWVLLFRIGMIWKPSRIWKENAEHLIAQEQGRETWYREYKTRIAKVERDYTWVME